MRSVVPFHQCVRTSIILSNCMELGQRATSYQASTAFLMLGAHASTALVGSLKILDRETFTCNKICWHALTARDYTCITACLQIHVAWNLRYL